MPHYNKKNSQHASLFFAQVENSQHAHFEQLILTLRRLGHPWAQRPLSDFHIKFGRVEGMSSRRGEVVLLRDILDEAKRRMADTMAAKQSMYHKI